jgi:hypothetical protein
MSTCNSERKIDENVAMFVFKRVVFWRKKSFTIKIPAGVADSINYPCLAKETFLHVEVLQEVIDSIEEEPDEVLHRDGVNVIFDLYLNF